MATLKKDRVDAYNFYKAHPCKKTRPQAKKIFEKIANGEISAHYTKLILQKYPQGYESFLQKIDLVRNGYGIRKKREVRQKIRNAFNTSIEITGESIFATRMHFYVERTLQETAQFIAKIARTHPTIGTLDAALSGRKILGLNEHFKYVAKNLATAKLSQRTYSKYALMQNIYLQGFQENIADHEWKALLQAASPYKYILSTGASVIVDFYMGKYYLPSNVAAFIQLIVHRDYGLLKRDPPENLIER